MKMGIIRIKSKNMKELNLNKLIVWICLLLFIGCDCCWAARKKVYMSYILHGNMNYDRYVRPTIWRDFPVIYNNLLDFMDEHPDFKGQVQFSGQTLKSLQQAAPEVVEHALAIHKRGQLNFTGTFYSEPVNVNMDGETNYRCAWLGTKIIEDIVGGTDGFYLQERAYLPQIPWILNHADVSWVPVITGDDSFYPFRLKGMDGSVSVCVPVTRRNIIDKIKQAPKNSLIVIEEDYEIPQSFSHTYQMISSFNAGNENIEVEWITVKEYIRKFGVQAEKYVDHSAKAKNRDDGTYSRWTADPLDIIVQDYTNHAMADFRNAKIVNTLISYYYGKNSDIPFDQSDLTLKEDPLIWNIERADLYPDIEPEYLTHNGEITLLSKAEHLLLWAVNSDSKGWNPLFEKRRERINSFENSSSLSKEVIYKGMDWISRQIKMSGYDRYYIVCNMEQERTKVLSLKAEHPYEVYDYTSGRKLKSQCVLQNGECTIDFETELPAYGYKIVGTRRVDNVEEFPWTPGCSIEYGKLKLTAEADKVILNDSHRVVDIVLDSFKIKALAEITDGIGDDEWRDSKAYGNARISVRQALYPQLRIEKQIDWLIHMQQIYTILNDKVLCDIHFVFPHPTLIRKEGLAKGRIYDPRGLNLLFKTHQAGHIYYDIPFGISQYTDAGVSYFCPLSTCFFQHASGGVMISPQTGEQAFSVDADKGNITLYLGASTTSGPIRDVGMTFVTKTEVEHEPAWYSEPFHGEYKHQVLLYSYNGDWKDVHVPLVFRNYAQPVYIRECYSSTDSGNLPAEKTLVEFDNPNIEITTMELNVKGIQLRLNEREGLDTKVQMRIKNKATEIRVPVFGIVTQTIE